MNYNGLGATQACNSLNWQATAQQSGSSEHDRTSAGVTYCSLDTGVSATSYSSSGFIGQSNSIAPTPAASNINGIGYSDQTTTATLNPGCSTTSEAIGIFNQSPPMWMNNSENGYISFTPCPRFTSNTDMSNVAASCPRCNSIVQLDRLVHNASTTGCSDTNERAPAFSVTSNHPTDSGNGVPKILSSSRNGRSSNIEQRPHFRLSSPIAPTSVCCASNGHGPPLNLSNADSCAGCTNGATPAGPHDHLNASNPSGSNKSEQETPFGSSNDTSNTGCPTNIGLGSLIQSNATSSNPGCSDNNDHGSSFVPLYATYWAPGQGPTCDKSNTASLTPRCANNSGHETHFGLSNATRSTPTCPNIGEHGQQLSLSNVNASHPGTSNNSGLAEHFGNANANSSTSACYNSEYVPLYVKSNAIDSHLGCSNNSGQIAHCGQANATISSTICPNNSSVKGHLGHSNATTSCLGCSNNSTHEEPIGQSIATASDCSTTVDLTRFVNQSANTSSTPQITINFSGSSGQPLTDSIPGGSLAIIIGGSITQPSTAKSSIPCGPSSNCEEFDRTLVQASATSPSRPKCPTTLEELREGLHEIFGHCGKITCSDGNGACSREVLAREKSHPRAEHSNSIASKTLLANVSCPSLPLSQQFEYGDDLFLLTVFEDIFTQECYEILAHCTVQHISAPKPNQNVFFDVTFRKGGLLVISGVIKASVDSRPSQRISAMKSDIVGSEICVSKANI